MTNRVEGAFTFDKWVGDDIVHWGEAQMQRNKGTKTFTGGLTGTSVIEAVMLGVEGGAMLYVAVEKLDLEFDGLKGGFFLAHKSSAFGSAYSKSLEIVPGSGSGDLQGISGKAEILAKHDFVLEYDLES